MNSRFIKATASVGYLGLLPGSGTWGSLAGLGIAWFTPIEALPIIFIVFSVIGYLLCAPSTQVANNPDPSWFVLDEVCGMLLSVLWLPKVYAMYLVAFVLFRLLDIYKPWPIWVFERNMGKGGILWDDLAAGGIAAAILYWGIKAAAILAG